MGAHLYTSMGEMIWPTSENDPPACVFPHACARHVARGFDEHCQACRVYRWYQQQQQHIRAMAVARIREVSVESEGESKLQHDMQKVAAVLTEKNRSTQR